MDPISKPAIMKETNGKQSDISEPDPDDILVYSRVMTRSLFSKQIYSYSDGLAVPDTRNAVRKEFVKKIKAKDLYSSFVDQSTESNHPLVRPIPATISLGSTTESVDEKDKFLGRQLSVVVKDDKKTIVQTKKEVGTKSARALLNPWINSIDRKAQALEEIVKPEWHPPWKLYRIICGHGGWVHSLAVDPSNMWLASGCKDGLIKIWDIASGRLRVTLTGHISGVRGLAVSDRHPYLFSCADDKMVKCWDLEQNQVVRHYHGHLSGVYCLAIHPTENLLVTGGRDSVARVWDMRSKEQIHCLTGHNNTVGSVQCLENNPQLITGSYDTTIRLWDMKMGKTLSTMTNHKKSVRSLAINHDKTSFASGATDNIKQWTLPEGKFIQNLSGHDCIINSLATNKFNVLASGADNGSIFLWDWRTGYNFQKILPTVQRGSIESEAGILALTFDRSGARMITGESDKTIKMYREDPNATEDTHPIKWTPDILHKSRF